jgi:hypothetical protein
MATIIFIYLHIFSVLRHLSSQREKQQICHFFSINEGTKLCGTIKVTLESQDNLAKTFVQIFQNGWRSKGMKIKNDCFF